jgi:Bacterial mobilisation protein (MobC)
MSCTEILKARVSPEIKRQARMIADRQLLSEAAWLKGLVIREIGKHDSGSFADPDVRRVGCAHRHDRAVRDSNGCLKPVYVRLRDEDRLLLQARAAARGLRPATYLSVLTRSHLRSLAPLPKDELLALKGCIAELAAIGRNLNQIARAANQGGQVGPMRDDLRTFLRLCMAMRDYVKGTIKANVTSWEAGHAQTEG